MQRVFTVSGEKSSSDRLTAFLAVGGHTIVEQQAVAAPFPGWICSYMYVKTF
jgi:hypothetical protein